MIQFKEKARRQEQVRTSLLTYPILMAADILLYDTDEVPVGDDQRQHVELARDLAVRFNTPLRPTFTVPEAVHPPVAARVLDLAAPGAKMSKSTSSAAGALRLLDPPELLRRKVMRARHRRGRRPWRTTRPRARGGQPARHPGRLHRRGARRAGRPLRRVRRAEAGRRRRRGGHARAAAGALPPARGRARARARRAARRRRAGPPPRRRHRAPGPHGDRAPALLKPTSFPKRPRAGRGLATVGASRMRGLDRGVCRIGGARQRAGGAVRGRCRGRGAACCHGWRAAAAERLGPAVLHAFAAALSARLQAQAAAPPPEFDFTAAAALRALGSGHDTAVLLADAARDLREFVRAAGRAARHAARRGGSGWAGHGDGPVRADRRVDRRRRVARPGR